MNVGRLRNGWLDFFEQQGFTHAVTFKPNDMDFGRSTDALHRLFVKTYVRLCRAMLGGNYNCPGIRRDQPNAVGIVEGLPHVGHLHCAFRIKERHRLIFERQFAAKSIGGADLWGKLVPNGSCAVERIWEPAGWHSYSMKQVWEVTDTDRIMLLPLPVAVPVVSV